MRNFTEFLNEGAYEKAEENKKSADSAKKQGDMFAHHLHMADHHDNMAEWHASKGRHGEADKHAEKSEKHHAEAMKLKESVELEESMTDSWKKVQSMDKGSVTGDKEQVKKRLAYLNAVHDHHKKFGNDTKKVKGEIEAINRSRIAEESAPVAPTLVKHRIGVTVSDPNHTMASKRKEKIQKFVRVTHSGNKEGAQRVGEKHFKKQGYIVHDSHHAGMVNEEVELDEAEHKTYGYQAFSKTNKSKWIADGTVKAKSPEHAKKMVQAKHPGSSAHVYDMKEEVALDEKFINGREYASHGLMHPDHAKMPIHQKTGQHVDFYASKTGDKMQGKVTKNDGKEVHIQAHKDKELGDGKLHKFKVTPHLPKQQNEETQLKEGSMTDAQMNKREEIVKGMKKSFKDFVAKYGSEEKAKSVMYATATKLAMKEDVDAVQLEEGAGDMYRWSDVNRSLMAIGMPPSQIVKVLLNLRGKAVSAQPQQNEETEQDGDVVEEGWEDMLKASKERHMRVGDSYRTSQGTATRTATGVRHERRYHDDDDHDEDEKKPAASTEKRGRGRPKGSTSGARQQGSGGGKDYRGIATHSLNLPNTRK